MEDIINRVIASGDKITVIREEALKIYKSTDKDQCFSYAVSFYKSEHVQVQELAVFLLGYIAAELPEALAFLKETVSRNSDWKVQEILAMAFDNYCKDKGYEKSLPVINEWLVSDTANVRRAVTEGLRIWTSRPYFKENPQAAICILSALKGDESEYVRKSAGNALKDISKRFPDLIRKEIETWDISDKKVKQVYTLAGKFINK